MNISRVSTTFAMLIVGALTVAAPARPAAAQTQPSPTVVAICNPLIVATQSQEYKDLQDQLLADQNTYNATLQEKGRKIKADGDELKLLVPDSPQYNEKTEAFNREEIDATVWKEVTELAMKRKEKRTLKVLFDKIQAMTQQVATKQGINLVIVDRHEDITDQELEALTPQQLQQALMERTILYSDIKLDITQTVIVALNKAYSEKQP